MIYVYVVEVSNIQILEINTDISGEWGVIQISLIR